MDTMSAIGQVYQPHHKEAIENIERHFKVNDSASIVMPPGTGKTTVAIGVANAFIGNLPVLVLVESNVLCEQLNQAFTQMIGNDSSVILKNETNKASSANVHIASVQTLKTNLVNDIQYGLVIIFDIGISAELQKLLEFGSLSTSKLLFISSVIYPHIEKLAGKPIYNLTFLDAVKQGILRRVEYKTGPSVDLKYIGDNDYLAKLFSDLIQKYSAQPESRGLVICPTIETAEKVYEALSQLSKALRPVLLHTKIKTLNEDIRSFASGDNYSIAIVVNLFVGTDFSGLTDVILLRKFGSYPLFQQAVGRVTRLTQNANVGVVWDFADNKNLFDEEMGTVFVKDDSEVKGAFSSDLVCPLEDKPAQKDLLGRKGLVDTLKGMIDRESNDHLIIALFGRWGSGKSSVLRMLGEKYSQSSNRSFITFNAWQAEHSNNISASIANQLTTDLYESKGIVGQIILSLKARLLKSKTELLLEFVFISMATIFGIGYLLPELIGDDFNIKREYVASLALAFPTIYSLLSSYHKHPFTGKLKELSKRPDFNEHIGLGYSIREQIFCLLSVYPMTFFQVLKGVFCEIPANDHKYILVIDDLDRCSDNKIIETLEAVQLVVDLPKINVLLAVAPEVLLDAVASRYINQRRKLSEEEGQKLARNFLGKILQITVTLDKPSSLNRNNFITSRLYADLSADEPFNPPPVQQVKSKKQLELSHQPEDIMDFEGYSDEFNDNYERSADYLESTQKEYEFFVQCSDLFDIHNPRTLIRIHNAITLLKGLYPSISGTEGKLTHYIYLVFWFEVYATESINNRKVMLDELLSDNADDVESAMFGGSSLLSFDGFSDVEIKEMLYRVKNMSLPAVELNSEIK